MLQTAGLDADYTSQVGRLFDTLHREHAVCLCVDAVLHVVTELATGVVEKLTSRSNAAPARMAHGEGRRDSLQLVP